MTPDPTGEVLSAAKYQAALYLETDGGWFITIENQFVLRSGETVLSSADRSDEIAEALQGHLGRAIDSFVIGDHGSLTIRLGDDEVHVEPHPKYEAWNVVGPLPDKPMVVCLPGGELAIWS